MLLKSWEQLPEDMRTPAVRPYYERLQKKKAGLIAKRAGDVLLSAILIVLLSPVLLVISLVIVCDSRGGVFFVRNRVTTYGRVFRIFKFRTMVSNAESLGSQVTVSNDSRVTRCGRFLRKYRLDELPQLFNIFVGEMSFVGTRPEVPRYVQAYTEEMRATRSCLRVYLTACIEFKDEDTLLQNADDADRAYVEEILPQKMKYNLKYLREYRFGYDICLMFQTVAAVLH